MIINSIAGCSYKFITSREVTTSTTSTSASTAITMSSLGSELYTADKIIYVRIRDKAGKRAGYFYGSDNYIFNYNKANGGTGDVTTIARLIHRYSTSSQFATYVGATTTGYGVYVSSITSNGSLAISKRYNSSYSLTVNGTYVIEVYYLEPAGGISPFA